MFFEKATLHKNCHNRYFIARMHATFLNAPSIMSAPKPIVLIVLDGWGHREKTKHNAIASAKTPNWDQLWNNHPHTLLEGSGHAVGLPEDQMGNSEVGHLTMGAGRTVYQEFTRIEKSIDDGEFFHNPVFLKALNTARTTHKAVHILGLLSPGGVHSHERQLQAIIDLAAREHVENIYVHAFLDGRDTPPQSALASLQKVDNQFKQIGRGRIASIIGRYYAMDRDKRWERVQKAYELLTEAKADFHAATAEEGLNLAYQRGETDEFVQATVIFNPQQAVVKISDGDVVIFMNYRADRARQLTRAFIEHNFDGFKRNITPKLAEFISLTEYAKDIRTNIAFPPQRLKNVLGEYVAKHHIKQLRIAETEKYAHVTFFFNGGIEQPFANEDRVLIPSQKVATYDLKPEMSAVEITDKLAHAIKSEQYGLIICNYANPDMVGHTGNFEATVKAIECIDECLGHIINALRQVGGEVIITADHGNAECMYDEETKQPHTAHTSDLVPFVYYGRTAIITHQAGTLADIAPTLLYLMGLPQPKEMTGQSLILCRN